MPTAPVAAAARIHADLRESTGRAHGGWRWCQPPALRIWRRVLPKDDVAVEVSATVDTRRNTDPLFVNWWCACSIARIRSATS